MHKQFANLLIGKFANFLSNFAHKFVGYPQISCYLYISKLVSNLRVLIQKVVVTLFGGFAKGINHTAL